MGLIGIIVGFGAARLQGGMPATGGSAVVQAPTAAAPTPQAPGEPETAQNLPPVTEDDHIRGDLSSATVAVIEYSDFECPFCQRHHPTMQQIMTEYGDKVVWVYRHFPLSFHPNAQKSAEASECAAEIGGKDAFWTMTDKIFEKGADNTRLTSYATEIGLNESRFKTCLDSGKFAQKVQDHMNGGSQAGVSGTPGNIVLNLKTQENRIVSGAQPFANFKTVIDQLLGS
jgi:protein-disulfide isomerase